MEQGTAKGKRGLHNWKRTDLVSSKSHAMCRGVRMMASTSPCGATPQLQLRSSCVDTTGKKWKEDRGLMWQCYSAVISQSNSILVLTGYCLSLICGSTHD